MCQSRKIRCSLHVVTLRRVREEAKEKGEKMTYARDHRKQVRKALDRQKRGQPLRKWEQKRLEHDRQGGEGRKRKQQG